MIGNRQRPIKTNSDLEVWRQVPDYPNYESSTLGRIKRVAGGRGAVPGRILSPNRTGPNRDRLKVTIYHQNRGEKLYIHHLVASAFLGPRPIRKEVNHIDGNPGNNRIENIEYATKSENIRHAHRTGLCRVRTGEAVNFSKLTEAQVREIWPRVIAGEHTKQLAREFAVSRSSIWAIRERRTWASVTSNLECVDDH